MSQSFANLLRSSRLASYDRKIPQVYVTPTKQKATGNWGLKRNLPTVIRARHITISDLDTTEHQTPWRSGNSQVLFVKRWKENFPNSKKPEPRQEDERSNIATMTPAEFQRFLKKAAKKAPAFRDALKNKTLVPEQMYDFLNVEVNGNVPTSSVVGPTYSDHEFGWNYPVQGRILNSDVHGFAVGISGAAALLQRRHAIGLNYSSDRRVRTFYVKEASIDNNGKPNILVNLVEQESSALSSFLSGDQDHDPFNPYKKPSRGLYNEDESKPNPDHKNLMARITGLFD